MTRSYSDIMDMVSDDELWAKRGDLVASTLYARNKAGVALDLAFIEAFSENIDTVSKPFTTSTGRPGRVILVVGQEATKDADEIFGEPTE